MSVWFNEIEPFPAQWLRNLWPEALVDERSVADLSATDPVGTRCHFFAGIGGWEYALELAGWPAEREVWTGSCPCQPFSAAGKGLGQSDPRHLWPAWFRLIRERHPECIFGEQVASAIGHGWLDDVFADLEGEGYACGAVVLGAHSVGAPHIRQRLYWVGYSKSEQVGDAGQPRRQPESGERVAHRNGTGSLQRQPHGEPQESEQSASRRIDADGRCEDGGVADSMHTGPARLRELGGIVPCESSPERAGAPGRLGDTYNQGPQGRGLRPDRDARELAAWSHGVELIPCADGKARPVEPGIFPLADGVPYSRVAVLRAAGNAIVPQCAAAFVRSFMEATE